ncbi:MAG: hypothetical protein ACYDHY_06470 [Acidiferrobacterales bacterium]
MDIIHDTGWNKPSARANLMRGYHDYERDVEFSGDTTDEEVKAFFEKERTIQGNHHDLYMWWHFKRLPYDHRYDHRSQPPLPFVCRLTYGYDSSD